MAEERQFQAGMNTHEDILKVNAKAFKGNRQMEADRERLNKAEHLDKNVAKIRREAGIEISRKRGLGYRKPHR